MEDPTSPSLIATDAAPKVDPGLASTGLASGRRQLEATSAALEAASMATDKKYTVRPCDTVRLGTTVRSDGPMTGFGTAERGAAAVKNEADAVGLTCAAKGNPKSKIVRSLILGDIGRNQRPSRLHLVSHDCYLLENPSGSHKIKRSGPVGLTRSRAKQSRIRI